MRTDHAAGMSPHMASADDLIAANALGTLNVHRAFEDVLAPGGCLVDVSSLAAHLVPGVALPRGLYPLADADPGAFVRRLRRRLAVIPAGHRAGLAYAISKDYVLWLARTDAARLGRKGLRVVSVSPGYVDTPMGDVEADAAASYLPLAPIPRLGRPDKLAAVIAFCAGPDASYLTGTDVLCDGGIVGAGINPLTAARSRAA